MIDATGQRFPDFMRQTVIAPLAMTRSSFEQPLPPSSTAPPSSCFNTSKSVFPSVQASGKRAFNWSMLPSTMSAEFRCRRPSAYSSHILMLQTFARAFEYSACTRFSARFNSTYRAELADGGGRTVLHQQVSSLRAGPRAHRQAG